MRLGYGSGGVDFQQRVNYERLRADRLTRLQQVMREEGLPALLVTKPENIRYATALRGPVFAAKLRYALVLADGEPVMYEIGDMLDTQRSHAPWIPEENWRFSYSQLDGIAGKEATRREGQRFADSIAGELRDRGLAGERVGFDALDEPSRAALEEVGHAMVPSQASVLRARSIKSTDEIACMQLSIELANVAFSSVLQSLKPWVTEREVGTAAYTAMLEAGAENPSGRVRSGPHTYDLYHVGNTDRRIEVGDLVTMNTCSTTFNNYKNCVYRNFVVGRTATAQERDWNTKCYERVHRVIDAIRPGATTADAAQFFPPASDYGYEADQRLIIAELGHGYGMSYEPPVISRVFSFDFPQVFEPGMVIAVESREGELGKGGVRLEEMVLVTETGTELLTRFPADRITEVATVWG
jgi:Xaa-Pro aminopeptidase